jgi:hypothetical protein
VAEPCENGNEPSSSIKRGIFLLAERQVASQEGLCCIELVKHTQIHQHLSGCSHFALGNISSWYNIVQYYKN